MSTLDRLFAEAGDLEKYARLYAQYVSQLLASLDCAAIQRVGQRLEAARAAHATVFILGNGGSASTASHFANDLGFGPRRIGGESYRAISLADNVSFLTAAANDLQFDDVFVEQLKTLLRPGDLVLAISASGNSPNIVKAAQWARANDAIVVAFTGFTGGQLRDVAHEAIHVATAHGDYGPVEDVHLFLDHLLTSYLARLTARIAAETSDHLAASLGAAIFQSSSHSLPAPTGATPPLTVTNGRRHGSDAIAADRDKTHGTVLRVVSDTPTVGAGSIDHDDETYAGGRIAPLAP